MAPILVLVHIKCTSHETQQTVIESLRRILQYTEASEPGVTKYAITAPRAGEPGHDTDILMIEEYIDQAAHTAHMESPAVKELLALFQSGPSPVSSAPNVYKFPPSTSYTRPAIKDVKNPIIISAHFGYQPGKSTPALDGWKPLVDYAEKEEPGTLSYAVLDDQEKSFIRTAEVYENQEVINSHLKGPLVAENQRQNGEWRSGERFVFRCTLVAGYFLK